MVELKGMGIEASTASTVSAAQALGHDITALVAGDSVGQAAQEAASSLGVSKVLLAQHAALKHQLAEPMSLLLKSVHDKWVPLVVQQRHHVYIPKLTYTCVS